MTDYLQRLISRGVGAGDHTVSTSTRSRDVLFEGFGEEEDLTTRDQSFDSVPDYEGPLRSSARMRQVLGEQTERTIDGGEDEKIGEKEERPSQRNRQDPIQSPLKMASPGSATSPTTPMRPHRVSAYEDRDRVTPFDNGHRANTMKSKVQRDERGRGTPSIAKEALIAPNGMRGKVGTSTELYGIEEEPQQNEPHMPRRTDDERLPKGQDPELIDHSAGTVRIMGLNSNDKATDRSMMVEGPVIPDTKSTDIERHVASVMPIRDQGRIVPDLPKMAIEPHRTTIVPSRAMDTPVTDENGKEHDSRVQVRIGTIEIRGSTPSEPDPPPNPVPIGFDDYDHMRRYLAREGY